MSKGLKSNFDLPFFMTVLRTHEGSVSVQFEDVAAYRGLNPQQHREIFEDRGYTVLTDIVDDEIIAEWSTAIKNGRDFPTYPIYYNYGKSVNLTSSLSKMHKKLASLTQLILGRSLPEDYQQSVNVFNNVVEGIPLHTDGIGEFFKGMVRVARIWVPLIGYDQDASWLSMVPGSHLRNLGRGNVGSLIFFEQDGLVAPVDLEGRTGYGILFGPDVAHGSSQGQIGHERTSVVFNMIADTR